MKKDIQVCVGGLNIIWRNERENSVRNFIWSDLTVILALIHTFNLRNDRFQVTVLTILTILCSRSLRLVHRLYIAGLFDVIRNLPRFDMN